MKDWIAKQKRSRPSRRCSRLGRFKLALRQRRRWRRLCQPGRRGTRCNAAAFDRLTERGENLRHPVYVEWQVRRVQQAGLPDTTDIETGVARPGLEPLRAAHPSASSAVRRKQSRLHGKGFGHLTDGGVHAGNAGEGLRARGRPGRHTACGDPAVHPGSEARLANRKIPRPRCVSLDRRWMNELELPTRT